MSSKHLVMTVLISRVNFSDETKKLDEKAPFKKSRDLTRDRNIVWLSTERELHLRGELELNCLGDKSPLRKESSDISKRCRLLCLSPEFMGDETFQN